MTDILAQIKALMQNAPVLVVGRAGMDLYPLPDGASTVEASEFRSDLGGSAANIAVAISRLGYRASLLSVFSHDPVGRYVARQLQSYQVDIALCRFQKGQARNSLAIAETKSENAEVVIYRNDAADLHLSPADVEKVFLQNIAAVVITGTALSAEPSRSAVFKLVAKAKAANRPTLFDIDYRAQAWPDVMTARPVLAELANQVDICVGNDDEFATLDPYGKGYQLARGLSAMGKLVFYKKGARGCETMYQDKQCEHGIFKVEMLKPFGAGDAFLGGVLASIADGYGLKAAVRRGSANAALVVSTRGCASAMPDKARLNAFIKNDGS